LIDSHSSSFWLISSLCNTANCKDKQKVTPISNLGTCELYYNMGAVFGTIDSRIVHLNSLVLENQNVFLINALDFPKFTESNLDGVFGISKIFSPLHHKAPYTSVLENVLKYIKNDHISAKVVLILKLGGNSPYLKIYYMEDYDYYHIRFDEFGKKETIFWINLFDKGKLMFALKHVKLKYYNKNILEREEYAVKECLDMGCRAMIDTKSYFIYGPADQISVLKSIKTNNYKETSNLPDIEFSFYDVDPSTSTASSSVELTLKPEDYLVKDNSTTDQNSEEDNYVVGIGDHKTDYGWNFGILFLKKFMVVYDFKDDKVGFVRVYTDDD
jgi:hypothetical protein